MIHILKQILAIIFISGGIMGTIIFIIIHWAVDEPQHQEDGMDDIMRKGADNE